MILWRFEFVATNIELPKVGDDPMDPITALSTSAFGQ